ncbi:MAG: hypothetical protein ACOCUA_02355 [archaeon]
MTRADIDQPTAWTENSGIEARAETIEFPELDVIIERGDTIEIDRNDRPDMVFHSAVMDDRGMWAILYAFNGDPDNRGVPGGHGPGYLKMRLRSGEWEVASDD